MTARSVIARGSQVKIAITLLLFFAAIALVCWQFWGDPPESWFINHPHDNDGSLWEWRKWIVWICAAILLVLGLCGVRQWWRYGAAYVSIENGIVQGYFGAAPLEEIKDISLGYRKIGVRQAVILLTLRNGGELTIPLWVLTEPGPVILARLQNILKNQHAA